MHVSASGGDYPTLASLPFCYVNPATKVGLPALAEGINREHAECERAYGSALEHAAAAGAMLGEAKSQVGVGARPCEVRPTTAARPPTFSATLRVTSKIGDRPRYSRSIWGATRCSRATATLISARLAFVSCSISFGE